MEADLQKKLEKLKEYLSKNTDISMAFIFGSYAKGQQISESDFDIAVYFCPEGKTIEWEETKYYNDEDKIWGEIEKIIGIKTDFVVLNRASSILASSIVREGTPVIIKDRSLYLRFLLIISSAAENFREFVYEFWKIKQRSFSISEDDKIRVSSNKTIY
ncbi:MAG: type VII toxin-antitoxin system MntA family adenylyltransferase antitoxin [bacterium]